MLMKRWSSTGPASSRAGQRPTQTVALCLSVMLVALITGCAAPAPTPEPAPRPAQAPTAPEPVQTPPGPAATLLVASEQALNQGDAEQAAALLERAIRIDPDNGELWLALARARFEQGEFDQTEQLARRAITLLGNQPQLEQDAWLLIDRATAER